MFDRLSARLKAAQDAVDARRRTSEGQAEFAKLEARLEKAKQINLERAPRIFKYVEWILIFAVVDYSRQVTPGVTSWSLLAAEIFLAITVHYYIVARLPPVGKHGLNWGNLFSPRGWIVPLGSVLLTVAFFYAGYSLATAMAEVQYGEKVAPPSIAPVDCVLPSTSLAMRSPLSDVVQQCRP